MDKNSTSIAKDITKLQVTVEYIQKKVDEIAANQERDYVLKTEFEPVKKVVYGMVSIVLTAVVVALVGLLVVR